MSAPAVDAPLPATLTSALLIEEEARRTVILRRREDSPALDAVAAFLEHLAKARDASPHTIVSYRHDLVRLVAFLDSRFGGGGWTWGHDVDRLVLRDFLASLKRNGIGNRSIARALATVRSFYDYLRSIEAVTANPARLMRSPKFAAYLPAYPSVAEMGAVFAALEAEATRGRFADLRDLAVLELLYSTGMRVGEAHGLNRDDVELANQSVRVRGKGKRERIVPIGEHATGALQRYDAARLERIHRSGAAADRVAFLLGPSGRRISMAGLQQAIEHRLRRTIGNGCRLSAHSLRHACATHLLDAGANLRVVQELLGHARITSTAIYCHTSIAQLTAVYDRAHPRANGDPVV